MPRSVQYTTAYPKPVAAIASAGTQATGLSSRARDRTTQIWPARTPTPTRDTSADTVCRPPSMSWSTAITRVHPRFVYPSTFCPSL